MYSAPEQILNNVRSDVENSLRRLKIDYIDIYQLHEGHYESRLALELQSILDELFTAGKIRSYDWSTDIVDNARVFASGEQCTSIQFRPNATFDNAPISQVCADFNLAGINLDPLNKGFHDNMKPDVVEWAKFNCDLLTIHRVFASWR